MNVWLRVRWRTRRAFIHSVQYRIRCNLGMNWMTSQRFSLGVQRMIAVACHDVTLCLPLSDAIISNAVISNGESGSSSYNIDNC